MTDKTTTAAKQIAGFDREPSSGDTAQPKHDPNLTEVEADDGFDEEYEFVAPVTRPAQPSIDPDAGNEGSRQRNGLGTPN